MMGKVKCLGVRLGWLGLIIGLLPAVIWAEEVGRFTQVEGQVEVFKPGKPKAIPVVVQTGAEANDRIKTEALSRAQIQLLDASTLMVAPLSDITIESYRFDQKIGLRQGLSQVAKGLVHLVLKPLEKLEHKDFLIKTPTAVMGIRGTELYILIGDDFSDIYVKTGRVTLASNLAGRGSQSNNGAGRKDQSASLRRLQRDADVRGAGAGANQTPVTVGAMQAGRVFRDRSAFVSCSLTEKHFRILEGLMRTGLPAKFQACASCSEMLELLAGLVDSLEYSPIDSAVPSVPVIPFPGGGRGGGGGSGVASPSS